MNVLDFINSTPRELFTKEELEVIKKVNKNIETSSLDEDSLCCKIFIETYEDVCERRKNEKGGEIKTFKCFIEALKIMVNITKEENPELDEECRDTMKRDYGIEDMDVYNDVCKKMTEYMSKEENLIKALKEAGRL